MFTFENRVGRLMEFRMATPIRISDVQEFLATLQRVLAGRAGKFICCSDFRRMNVMAPDVAESLLGILKHSNVRIERNGFWVSEGAVFALQSERILREAGHPGRHTFRTRSELEKWVGEPLDATERARLAEFLGEAE
jgi:hypothetical protein